ncbi:MAG: sulfatase-like hydrolase/transferase [Lachnospiraceae bacterium]|nr:sulfatase-like hydrolase/transferase [Lachnospiraceae bacterium]
MSNKLIKDKLESESKKLFDFNEKQLKIMAIIMFLIMPFFDFYMFETIVGNFEKIMENTMGIILLNLCIWYLLYMLLFSIINHVKYTILILNTVSYIFALANAFVVQFRDQPIMIMDIKSLSTAISVSGEYSYEFTSAMIGLGIVVLLINVGILVLKVDFVWKNWRFRLSYAVFTIVCIVFSFHGMLAGDWFARAGSTGLDFFKFNLTYQTQGYMACTVQSLRYFQIEEPEGYSVSKVEEIADNVKIESKSEENLPENIIVIMNESFADLSVLGDIKMDEPILSNFYGISGNVKHGNVYVSVYGGGTANSEFEFLTGNTVADLPAGTVAYQMYVEEGDSSIVSILKDRGYRTIAFHPYRKENYNRPKVYEWYGFDEYYGKDDVKVKKVRNYASDKSDYKALIKMYEEKQPGEKLFIFNITMQNHGGYDYEKFKKSVTLTDYPGEFPQAEQYLGLMKKSDEALKYLIDYFTEVDEKTVILFFGDHQPKLEDGFYERVMGAVTAENSFIQSQQKQITPYMLWSNYELDAEAMEYTSTNYLGSYLLDAVGVELPIYNQYLLELQKKVPAVNHIGYLDTDNVMHWNGEDGEERDLLDEYQMFQYNNLFDKRNRCIEFFE